MAKKRELTDEEKYEEEIDNQIVDLIMKKKGINHSAASVSNVINKMYGKIIQRLLDTEFDQFMGYDKNSHEDKSDSNRRNGKSEKPKNVRTDNGNISIYTPRDRNGEFEPEVIKKRQTILEGFDNKVISMYAKGMSLTDIKNVIKEIYSIELSEQTLSEMTQNVSQEVQKWQNRQLEKCYPFVFVDCLYCYVKEDLRSIKKAIYVALGINVIGVKDILGLWIDNTESATMWHNIFEELKERGVEDIFFVSMDGLTGLEESLEKIYHDTIFQRCIVHIDRNIYSTVPKKDAKEVMAAFKEIYTASNLSNSKLAYDNFKQKYSSNSKLMKKVDDNIGYIYQLFDYPQNIRRIIYTTNSIESINAALRKVTRGKGSFVNENALLRVLFLRVKDLQSKWAKGMKDFKNVQLDLINIFGDRYLKYIEK